MKRWFRSGWRARLETEVGNLDRSVAEEAKNQARLDELAGQIDAMVGEQRVEVARLNATVERAERRARIRRQRLARAEARRAEAERRRLVEAQRLDATERRRLLSAEGLGEARLNGTSGPGWGLPVTAGQSAAAAALTQVGKPYEWAADGPETFDCSGLTMWAWGQAGVSLPHNSGMQYAATERVDPEDWQPGDLLFFGAPIHHVAMYIGGGKMVEAPYTGAFLRVESAIRSDYVGAGRPGA